MLNIHVKSAMFQRDMSCFHMNEPRYIINYKGDIYEGPCRPGELMNPQFNSTTVVDIGPEPGEWDNILFSFLMEHDLIVEANLPVSQLVAMQHQDQWIPCVFEGMQAGQMNIVVTYDGPQHPGMMGQHPGMGMPGMHPGMPGYGQPGMNPGMPGYGQPGMEGHHGGGEEVVEEEETTTTTTTTTVEEGGQPGMPGMNPGMPGYGQPGMNPGMPGYG